MTRLSLFYMAVVLAFPCLARADAPATEFFAIETAKLEKLAPTDGVLDLLTRDQLSEISTASGWYSGGLSMEFDTATFRIHARFTGSVERSGAGPITIGYMINASKDQTSWSLLSERGGATKLGKQFITTNWRKQDVTVILRYLDLRH